MLRFKTKPKLSKKEISVKKNIATFTTRLNNENWDFVCMSECAQIQKCYEFPCNCTQQ